MKLAIKILAIITLITYLVLSWALYVKIVEEKHEKLLELYAPMFDGDDAPKEVLECTLCCPLDGLCAEHYNL